MIFSASPSSKRATCVLILAAAGLAGCGPLGLSTSVGPSRGAIGKAPARGQISGMRVVELTDPLARRLGVIAPQSGFAEAIGDAVPIGTTVGVGDTLEVTIWEAPPAVLFSAAPIDTRVGSPIQGSRPSTLPELLVGPSGRITIPFAGQVPAASRTLQQIERDIVARLRGKANQAQAVVRIARNATATVTVVGEVANAARQPLSPRGERLLDALAEAGGTRQPVDRMTVQLTRGDIVRTMALQDVIREPRNNVILQKDDVITAIYQPFTFTVLGAAGRNEEVRFEGTGLTLSQALGRVGGLQDMRADPKGVFLFRWEDPRLLDDVPAVGEPADGGTAEDGPSDGFAEAGEARRPDGRIPVVYRIDMNNPTTYFAAQNFRMRDSDVVYISNSPITDFQRFVNILAGSVLPVVSVNNALTTSN